MHDYLTNLSQYLIKTNSVFPDNIAIITRKKSYTYSELSLYIEEFAIYLQRFNLQKGDRLLISTGNSIMSVISFWAGLKIGAIVIPIHPHTKNHHWQYILKEAQPSLIICTQSQQCLWGGIPKMVIVDPDILDPIIFQPDFNASFQNPRILDVDLAAIMYTSGSTGEPKGVTLSHRNMLAASTSIQAYLKYQSDDKIICVLPISFDYGLYQMILAFSVGATLILEEDFHWPLQIIKKISEEKATVFPLVSSMVSILHDHQKRFHYNLNSIRMITNTGIALTEKHSELLKTIFPKAHIYSMYGLTECKRCTYLPPEKLQEKPSSVGLPIPNSELWIIDEKGSTLKPHEIGEIVIRSATVMQGYWNQPEKTSKKIRSGLRPGDRILYTGDYGWLDEDGFLYIHGRADEMLKSRGIKISPLEIERILLKMPGIKEVSVIGVDDDRLGSAIVAFVICEENISLKSIRDFCKGILIKEKIPHFFHRILQMPKTGNGKIDKVALCDQHFTMSAQ